MHVLPPVMAWQARYADNFGNRSDWARILQRSRRRESEFDAKFQAMPEQARSIPVRGNDDAAQSDLNAQVPWASCCAKFASKLGYPW